MRSCTHHKVKAGHGVDLSPSMVLRKLNKGVPLLRPNNFAIAAAGLCSTQGVSVGTMDRCRIRQEEMEYVMHRDNLIAGTRFQ